MRILFEAEQSADQEQAQITPKRNIANVFDISVIQRELKSEYGIETNVSAKRIWSDDIWYVTITAPYVGKVKDLLNSPKGTVVALFVDYEHDTAFAMPRAGADKQTMMLIASISNKHIKEPFKCDSGLRYVLHSRGGSE